MTIHICMVTRNRSISATTLHTAMNIHMLCMQKGEHLEIHFMENKSGLPKLIKTGERIFWMDYGTNLNMEVLGKVLEPFEKGIQVLVFPSVKEGIDWQMFERKIKEGSTESVHQSALTFDTEVGKKLAEGLYECTKTSARVWAMDSKPVDKKLRGDKIPVKLPLDNNEEMFDCLRRLGVKIGAATEAAVVCHYVHECFGNILEAAGVQLGP
jgi:hypothetical protein